MKRCENCFWWKLEATMTPQEKDIWKVLYKWCIRFPDWMRKESKTTACGEFDGRHR